MSYLQRMEKRHPGLRSFLTVLLSAAMVLNSVPTQAFAEVVNEPQVVEIESVEDEMDATLDETKATEGEQPADEQSEDQQDEIAEPEGEPEEVVAPEGEQAAEEVAPAEPAQQAFVYEDEFVKVTAEPTNPSAIPADAELVVRAVTPASEDYYYDAFIDALNTNAEGDNVYSDKNTLLYDVMFLVWNEYGEQVEVEPADGSVKVNFEFKQNQLTDDLGVKAADDVDVAHLPIGDEGVQVEAVDSVAKGDEQIEMSVDSFSVYAFSYTVDFTYDGYTYSIEGESNIMLSKLFDILGIDEKIDNVENAAFSNPELVAVEQVEGDWQLTSLAPFDTNETLTVTLASGAKYVIDVTDAQGDVRVEFYDVDGTTIDSSASLDSKYYLVATSNWDGSRDAIAPINPTNGVAQLTFTGTPAENAGYKLVQYKGPDDLTLDYLNNNWNYDQNNYINKDVKDLGAYKWNDTPTVVDGVTVFQAVKQPAYTVEIVFPNGTASNIGSGYSVYAAVKAEDTNNGGKTDAIYYDMQNVTLDGVQSKSLTFTSFNRSNGNPSNVGYQSGDDVTVVLGKDLQIEANGSAQIDKGDIIGGTQVKDGDVLDGFLVSVTTGTEKTTYTFSKPDPYEYSIQESTSTPIAFDSAYTDNWYLLSTLSKSDGTYYYVTPVTLNGATVVPESGTGKIPAYYRADESHIGEIKIGSEKDNNYNSGNTKVSVYQPGDSVTNALVHVNKQAQNYKEIVTGDNNGRESFGNGSVANKYTVTTTEEEGVGTIKLTPVSDLKIKTVFKDDKDDEVPASNLPSGYKLLIKMVRDGQTYYALHTVDASKNPSDPSKPIVFHKYTESDGTGRLDTADVYYSGVKGETISTQVVTGANDLSVDLIQHKVAGAVFYNENTIGGTQSSDLTKDLYSTSSEIDKSNDAAHVMTTTFKKQKDDGVDHDINVSFYKKHEADISDAEPNPDANNMKTDEGAYFFRVRLYNNGKLVAYKIVPVSPEEAAAANSTGKFSHTIDANEEFQLVDDKGVDIAGGKLHYDPTVYSSDVRFYEAETAGDLPASLSEVSSKGSDTIDGYDFWQNVYSEDKDGDTITKTKTDLALYSAYAKKYEVKVVIDPAAEPKTSDDIRLKVEAAHKTTDVDKFEVNDLAKGEDYRTLETEDGKTVITYLVEDQTTNEHHWTPRGQETNILTGNETFTLAVQQGADGKQSEGFPVIINGEAYTVSYDTGMVEGTNRVTDDDQKVTTITHYVFLTEAEYEPALTPEEVLGDAHEFGVVADTYNQSGHSETNAAVKHYNNNSNFDIEDTDTGNKYSDVPFYIGEIQNQVIFGQGHYADTYIYTPQTEIDKHKINQANATRYNVSVIPTDLDDITDYIDGMIDSVRQTSEAMLQKTTIKPSSTIIDTTAFPDNTTIYVDCSDISSALGGNNSLQITKKDGQTIVFNIPDSGKVNIGQFTVYTPSHQEGVASETGSTAKHRDAQHSLDVNNVILQHIYFNMPNAGSVEIDTAAGMFLAPNAATFKQANGCGWIVCGGTVNSPSEWHFYRHNRHFDSKSGALQINKKLSDDAPEEAKNKQYKFYVREKQADNSYLYYYNAKPNADGTLNPAVTSSDEVELEVTGAGTYKLERIGFQTDADGKIIPRQLEVVEVDGSGEITGYTLEVSVDKESAKVTGGKTTYVNVTNTYTKDEQEETGTIKVTKTVTPEAAAMAAGSAEFPVTIKQGDKFVNAQGELVDSDPGLKVTAGGTLTIENVPLGTYTVTETSQAGVTGYTYTNTGSTVTGNAEFNAANETKTVALTGDLKITKTFGGSVTKEEVAKGSIKFEVKTADGKWLKADGTTSDTKVELTLGSGDGFTASDDGLTWTKEFKGVAAGEYTVTESNTEIAGHELVQKGSRRSPRPAPPRPSPRRPWAAPPPWPSSRTCTRLSLLRPPSRSRSRCVRTSRGMPPRHSNSS